MSERVKFCAACGAGVEPGARFCTACGEALAGTGGKPRRPRKSGMAKLLGGLALVLVAGMVIYAITAQPPEPPTNVVETNKAPTGQAPVPTAPTDATQSDANAQGDARPADTGPADAAPWQTYTNARYGVVVAYPPDIFTRPGEEPSNHAGREFSGEGGAWFSVYSNANALFQTPADFLEEEAGSKPADAIIEQRLHDNGYDLVHAADDRIEWRKLLVSGNGGFVHWLTIGWPREQDPAMRPVARRMASSLRVDPAIPESVSTDAEDDVAVDAFGYRRIASRDFGFDVEGIANDPSFFVEIPDFFVREGAADSSNELVFRSPDDDPDALIFLAFVGEPAAGRTAEDAAREQAEMLLDMGNGIILEDGPVRVGDRTAYRIRQKLDSPSDIDTMLVEDLVVFEQEQMVFKVALTAPEPIWHTAEQAMARALQTLAFAP